MNPNSKPIYDQVIVWCPWHKTGGTEALHQLASAITDLGGQAFICYMDNNSGNYIESDRIWIENSPHPGSILFDNYNITRKESFTITPKTAIVFPELYTTAANNMTTSTRIVWWLSVDNSPVLDSTKFSKQWVTEFFKKPDILHMYQSEYAKHLLTTVGVRPKFPLFDYVTVAPPQDQTNTKKHTVTYYPAKGKQLADAFFQKHRDLESAPIENMTQEQCAQTLADSAIFIDFGRQPGKDRVPREAAACGAVVLLRRAGSAKYFLDHPLPDQYLFDEQDLVNGSLYNKVYDILNNLQYHRDQQQYYRRRIALEKEEFYLQVKTHFFKNA